MSTSKWEARANAETVLSTELNSLANDGNKLSAAFDNYSSDKLYLYAEFELYLAAQSTRSAGAHVALFILPELDGSNYSYGDDSTDPSASSLVATFPLDAATNARYIVITGVVLPPTSFKILVENKTGVAFASSSNTLKMRRYNVQGV